MLFKSEVAAYFNPEQPRGGKGNRALHRLEKHLVLRDGLVSLEVFVFGVVQMRMFLKYGFFAMYVCRIGFYLSWHLLWGSRRLEILF